MSNLSLDSFDSLKNPWERIHAVARTKLLFSSAEWSAQWWSHFAADNNLYLGSVKEGNTVIGIAPLRSHNNILYFIGSDNVCDFLDFVIEEGKEESFFTSLLDHLSTTTIKGLDLSPLLPESTVHSHFIQMAANKGWEVSCEQTDVIVAADLPDTLEKYIASLSGKQRHELLRKERRLNEEGNVKFRIETRAAQEDINTFLHFFQESRSDKKSFLTPEIESFFKAVISSMSDQNKLAMGVLEINSVPAAATLCFDYQNDTYLYNSGYDPSYRWLSVGLLSKYFCIKDSIAKNKRRFDFLKGDEQYKYHLGGTATPVYRCIINKH
ncbi:MAG: GNAT family N-acetyltransferase [Dehalococcoidia bacterium]|nr:GNAT family N-acetyltransferase [Dehalococcoidia bacterium]MDD5493365.1 GNAT family N-acetyltransferase [Dehalococcoidia bacterium]